jgi:hypothetical protein
MNFDTWYIINSYIHFVFKDTRSANSWDATKQQKQRSQKEMKKLKEKLRINLENMRPIVTTNGKYPAAYNTPIIYDQVII